MASKSTSTLTSGYPLLGSSRHVRTNYRVPSSSPGFLYSDRFRHETCRPLFRRLAPPPLVPGYSHSLVGVGTESSEVVQETPLPLFFLHPHTARAPHQFSEHHALRQFRVHYARHKSCEQDLCRRAAHMSHAIEEVMNARYYTL